ncbi:MAG: hypothetical protein IKU19_05005, partial [Clostridia bacterium]|nr:hypothetical protein [Clostridia bacterium]
LSVIKDIEADYLGINHEIYLSVDFTDEGTLSYYSHREHKIVISAEHIKNGSPYDVLHTLLHESYHAYSYQVVDLYRNVPDEYKRMRLFKNAQRYEEEFSSYVNGNDDYFGYISQFCEMDANQYAEIMAGEYYCVIDDYKRNQGTDEQLSVPRES